MTGTRLRVIVVAVAGLILAAAASAQQQPDFSKVEIKTTHVRGNVYTLQGQGGTIGVFAGPDGILMVDSEFAPLSEKIAAVCARFPPRPSAS